MTPSGKVIPVTKAQTFRLPPDALQIIAEEKAEEAALGKRLTNDAAVAEALRMWGKARRPLEQAARHAGLDPLGRRRAWLALSTLAREQDDEARAQDCERAAAKLH